MNSGTTNASSSGSAASTSLRGRLLTSGPPSRRILPPVPVRRTSLTPSTLLPDVFTDRRQSGRRQPVYATCVRCKRQFDNNRGNVVLWPHIDGHDLSEHCTTCWRTLAKTLGKRLGDVRGDPGSYPTCEEWEGGAK